MKLAVGNGRHGQRCAALSRRPGVLPRADRTVPRSLKAESRIWRTKSGPEITPPVSEGCVSPVARARTCCAATFRHTTARRRCHLILH